MLPGVSAISCYECDSSKVSKTEREMKSANISNDLHPPEFLLHWVLGSEPERSEGLHHGLQPRVRGPVLRQDDGHLRGEARDQEVLQLPRLGILLRVHQETRGHSGIHKSTPKTIKLPLKPSLYCKLWPLQIALNISLKLKFMVIHSTRIFCRSNLFQEISQRPGFNKSLNLMFAPNLKYLSLEFWNKL